MGEKRPVPPDHPLAQVLRAHKQQQEAAHQAQIAENKAVRAGFKKETPPHGA